MEDIFARQRNIIEELERVKVNFQKDSADRKTREYLEKRIKAVDELWEEFINNHEQLNAMEDKSHEYFHKNIYRQTNEFYESVKLMLSVYPPTPRNPAAATPGPSQARENQTPATRFNVPKVVPTDVSVSYKSIEELMAQQHSNIRAFYRAIRHIHIESIDEKWELEDEIRNLQRRWNIVDELHLRIDCILQGSNTVYEEEFFAAEKEFNLYKKELNRRLSSTAHVQQSTPKVEIPVFTGKYIQWPTFFDLFTEAIHENRFLNKAQKMQHLKSKVRGEAERIIQHLHISAENYDTAWDLLTHRYNNPNALFTHQIELFLNQPSIQRQTSFELKRLYDTTMETVHAIHNLGIETNTWDPILVHLVAKKLDVQTYTDYKESLKSPRDLPSFDELMKFIESKFTALEPIRKNDRGLAPTSHTKPTPSFSRQPPRFNHAPNRANNYQNNYNQNHYQNLNRYQSKNYQAIATFTRKCPLCYANHALFQCNKFIELPADSKLTTITKLAVCQNCLYKHYGNKCISTKRCKECNGEHNSILHESLIRIPNDNTRAHNTSTSDTDPKPSTERERLFTHTNKKHNVSHVAKDDEEILLTTLSLKVKAADNSYIILRALLDQGSQISLISESAAQMLGLQRLQYHASVSGIGDASKQSRGIVSIECQSVHDDYHFTTQALVISRVINHLPNTSFSKQSWPHLQHLKLADPQYNISMPIDILLDASIYSQIIMNGLIKGPAQAPIAQQTKLGWILSGFVKTFNCHVVINNVEDISKYWELEDISHSSSTLTKEEQYCEDYYQATTRRLQDGRYEVALPMKPNFEQNLGKSKPKAIAQFGQLERKMARNQDLSVKYKQFMKEYQELGHMREASDVTNESLSLPTCYLPHHGVMKPDSTTTSLRVVFNASSPTSTGQSLNDLMECGPNLQQDLLSLIIRWRKYKYVVTADIEKMFRQIYLRESDQLLQTVVWRDSSRDLIRSYHLTTVTYGTKAAPFLAMRTLRQIAKDNVTTHPLAAAALETSFYMDDLLSGHESIEQVKCLQNQLTDILKGAGMNIRKWSSNEPELIKNFPSNQVDIPYQFKDSETRKTLGIQWNPSSDTFTYQNKLEYHEYQRKITKRQMLSDLSTVYDPVGWISPITIRAKMLFQKTWQENLSWDDELPQCLMNQWEQLRNDLKDITNFIIPRHLGDITNKYHLHGYSDASEKAYACAIYTVSQNNKGEYTSQLIAAKTKVAPCKDTVSLPRLELLGALLLSQLMKKVLDSLSDDNITITAWTDSMIVLGWLQGDPARWKQFVSNRVRQITEIIPSSQWRYIKSDDNPADCATRGTNTRDLINHSLWWHGHKTILDPKSETTPPMICPSPTIEIKKTSVTATLQSHGNNIIMTLLHNCSSISKVVNTVAWVLRFIRRTRGQTDSAFLENTLSFEEIQHAYIYIIRQVQSIDLEEDIKYLKKHGHVRSTSKLSSLHPFIDENEILRVGGRLENANLTYGEKHPIILSTHSRLSELIIYDMHKKTLHGGPKITLSLIRQSFWIIGGIRLVKKLLRNCVTCRRHKQETCQQLMADLPQPRVTPSRPFTNTGVDFTGFVDVKTNKGRGVHTTKGYVAVFVCLATKAVHLELVSDLSSAAFLAAFRRLCSRRGCPKNMYSDNGTNFVGASRILNKEYKDIISSIDPAFIKDNTEISINWHFNAPAWPNASGLMEAAVKSLKYHLKRVLGEQKLTYEEFTTLLLQIEAILNSRPLCALTENTDDFCITPGHFLIGDSIISRPQTDPDTLSYSSRWRLVQEINKQFWKKWSREYLQQLQSRSKWRTPSNNININDVVVIKEENMPPGKWALGRVHEIHPGQDGLVRVVTLKTQNGSMKRPVNKLILLSTQTNQDQPKTETKNDDSERDRERVKRHRKPILKSFFTTILIFFMLLSPSIQQSAHTHNITTLDHQTLFFDKMSDLQHIRDEWKLIIYYDLTLYWQGVSDIKNYIIHIKQLSKRMGLQYSSIILQLEHELKEIEHFNSLLTNRNKRQKRGLIDGIGYVANSLFGVLDERFAEQYRQDIKKITINENHLQTLLKNQTSIVEAGLNIIKRNEDIMNKQFDLIKQHLYNLTSGLERVSQDNSNGVFVTSTSLAASIIISSLQRTQQTLLDTITDVSHGRLNAHLLPPEELEKQVNIISGRLREDIKLPVDTNNINELYKLLRIRSNIHYYYLIIEIKIPLISNEVYELDKIISIPQRRGNDVCHITTTYPYIAFNLKRDVVILLSDYDLRKCIEASPSRVLCALEKPIYDLKDVKSICDLRLINEEMLCEAKTTACKGEMWTKLHRGNVWIYSCCTKCRVRIVCDSTIEVEELVENGMLTINQGCMLRSSSFTIYAHNHFFNNIVRQSDAYDIPQSVFNTVINTSLPKDISPYQRENHDPLWKQLQEKISNIKEQETIEMNVHDVHHYASIYVLATLLLCVAVALVVLWCRWRRGARAPAAVVVEAAAAASRRPRAPPPAPPLAQATPSGSVHSVNQANPTVFHSLKFEKPTFVKTKAECSECRNECSDTN